MTLSFDDLQTTRDAQGAGAMLDALAGQLRDARRWHDLFDVRLMQRRLALGLPPVLNVSAEELPTDTREALEEGYLAACREVGRLLLDEENVHAAWVYLRPVGDKAEVARAIEQLTPDDATIDAVLEVALHQGVAPARGVELMLGRYGPCSTISTVDANLGNWSPRDRRAAVAILVRRIHDDLLTNVRHDVERREGSFDAGATLGELVASRTWLLENDNYHLDTSHLHATVRLARLLETRADVRLAYELTEYGRRLGALYRYPGEPPFDDVYPAHGLFFAAQLGDRVDEAVEHFRQQAEQVDATRDGTGPAEVYVALLDRLGRSAEALEASARLLPPGTATSGFAPSAHDIATRGGLLPRWAELCQQSGDVLGFAAALAAPSRENSLAHRG